MENQISMPIKKDSMTVVNVAVAVIHHQDQYLLGFRDASQHQGNRYEFVGGKIDINESAKQALVREVAEETGLEISDNIAVKLGRLHHDYGDKRVCLQVYRIELTVQQYDQFKHRRYGLEGQALTWVEQSKLLAGDYHLPAANKTIIQWLKVPAQIAITYPLAHFSDSSNPTAEWLNYHTEHLSQENWVYIRAQAAGTGDSTEQLLRSRPDIQAIVPDCLSVHKVDSAAINNQIVAGHLTQTQLMQWLSGIENEDMSEGAIFSGFPLIVSCHDVDSIYAANQMAHARLHQQLPPIIGMFLSPILATQSHPDTTPLGWEAWTELAELADMPVIGLGGLSPAMSQWAMQYGGIAVAGIRQFHQ